MNKTKNTLLLFTGGLDSTFVLWKCAEANPEGAVVLLDADLYCPPNQRRMEEISRKKIVGLIYERYPHFSITDRFEYARISGKDSQGAAKLRQPASLASCIADAEAEYNEFGRIITGHVKGDDFMNIRPDWENAVKALLRCNQHDPYTTPVGTYEPRKDPVFEYPAQWYTKDFMYRELVDNFPEVVEHLWWCESMEDRETPCLVCPSCERMARDVFAPNVLRKEIEESENEKDDTSALGSECGKALPKKYSRPHGIQAVIADCN